MLSNCSDRNYDSEYRLQKLAWKIIYLIRGGCELCSVVRIPTSEGNYFRPFLRGRSRIWGTGSDLRNKRCANTWKDVVENDSVHFPLCCSSVVPFTLFCHVGSRASGFFALKFEYLIAKMMGMQGHRFNAPEVICMGWIIFLWRSFEIDWGPRLQSSIVVCNDCEKLVKTWHIFFHYFIKFLKINTFLYFYKTQSTNLHLQKWWRSEFFLTSFCNFAYVDFFKRTHFNFITVNMIYLKFCVSCKTIARENIERDQVFITLL